MSGSTIRGTPALKMSPWQTLAEQLGSWREQDSLAKSDRQQSPSGHSVVLVILDGWGIAPPSPGNAVELADTPVMDRLMKEYPTTLLATSGLAVGLPEGQMGNSEVGHLNIGAGFTVYQWITRINQAIADGSFAENDALNTLIDHCHATGGRLHCLGLIGDGGVHSHADHMIATVKVAHERGLRRVAVHAITDGRDASPTAGKEHIRTLQDAFQRLGTGRIASVSGRYYAMDRDRRWDRTERAYDIMTTPDGPSFTSALAVLDASYAESITDEFVLPAHVVPPGAEPIVIEPGDAVFMVNFRADRARQIIHALTDRDFSGFDRRVDLSDGIEVGTMTRYEEGLPVLVAFEPHDVTLPLAKVISDAGLKQAHFAETEKYAHVTFFLNGGREEPFPGEVRKLIPSPRVATYDLKPEMSAIELTDEVVAAIRSKEYPFVVVNYANGDMVGHTGNIPAAIKAIETVDRCLGRVIDAVAETEGVAIVTADHGNSEQLLDLETGEPMTAHTLNPVPFVLVTPDDHPFRHAELRTGVSITSIAPTVLLLMGIQAPPSMTAPSVILDPA